MARIVIVPSTEDKIGKKIDYIVKEVYSSLKDSGFERKARNIYKTIETKYGTIQHIIWFQGWKHNEGTIGRFVINLGICNHSASQLVSEIPSMAYLAKTLDKIEIATSQFQCRIRTLLPEIPEDWWPGHIKNSNLHDIWFEIRENTELPELGSIISRFINEYSLTWFQHQSTFPILHNDNSKTLKQYTEISLIAVGIILNDNEIVKSGYEQTMNNQNYSGKIKEEVHEWCQNHGYMLE